MIDSTKKNITRSISMGRGFVSVFSEFGTPCCFIQDSPQEVIKMSAVFAKDNIDQCTSKHECVYIGDRF